MVSGLIFQKISGEGLTEPPSPDPSPRFFSGFALGSGFALNSRAHRALDSSFALDTRALRALGSGFALNSRAHRALDSNFALDTRALRALDSGFALLLSIGDLGLAPKINSWIRQWLNHVKKRGKRVWPTTLQKLFVFHFEELSNILTLMMNGTSHRMKIQVYLFIYLFIRWTVVTILMNNLVMFVHQDLEGREL